MSTAPGRTFGSRPVTETLAENEPSMLNTTVSVWGGTIANRKSTLVWSPLKNKWTFIKTVYIWIKSCITIIYLTTILTGYIPNPSDLFSGIV